MKGRFEYFICGALVLVRLESESWTFVLESQK